MCFLMVMSRQAIFYLIFDFLVKKMMLKQVQHDDNTATSL